MEQIMILWMTKNGKDDQPKGHHITTLFLSIFHKSLSKAEVFYLDITRYAVHTHLRKSAALDRVRWSNVFMRYIMQKIRYGPT